MNYIIVTGSPNDGFVFYGPFEGFDEAEQWAQVNMPDLSWWAALLDSPHI